MICAGASKLAAASDPEKDRGATCACYTSKIGEITRQSVVSDLLLPSRGRGRSDSVPCECVGRQVPVPIDSLLDSVCAESLSTAPFDFS